MTIRYREYRIETQPQGNMVVFDVFKGQQHFVAGYEIEGLEDNIIGYLKDMINSNFETNILQIIRKIPVNRENR